MCDSDSSSREEILEEVIEEVVEEAYSGESHER
jgi:hypothetical protein